MEKASGLKTAELVQAFPFLMDPARQEIKEQFLKHVMVGHLDEGHHVCWEGDVCTQLAVVLSGNVRVYKVGENGREITLYRIGQNESCILTASCILSHIRFPALAVVESRVRAVLIPAAVLHNWIDKYDVWRNYVFELMSRRLTDVIATVEEVAFRRMDVRIAEFLLQPARQRDTIVVTHQQLAYELGTAREVVSRILKDFERADIIFVSRGSITIKNKQALLERTKSF